MDWIRVRRVSPGERRILHRMKRQLLNLVNSKHARVILLSSGGICNQEIAQRVDYSTAWVRKIIHRFNQSGTAGIQWWPSWQTYGPRKFFAEIVEQIAEVALSSPKSLIGMNQWSLSKLRAYLVSQKIISGICLEWLRQLLRRHGVRWRHTKTWKESTDPQFATKYRKLRRLYGRRPKNGRRICVDEFGPLNLQPHHGKCLAKNGRVQRHRATYHRFGGVQHFLAAYDLESGRLFGQFKKRKRWTEFLSFLKWVRRRYRKNEQLHIVLDNYSPHLKKEVHTWARRNRIKFYFTPSNASWLNRIESQFTALRKFALDNSDFQTHQQQQDSIKSYLKWRNGLRKIAIEPWRKSIQKKQTKNWRHAPKEKTRNC
jgi:transposase